MAITFSATAPSTPKAGDGWQNTTTGLFQQRDSANASWVPIFNSEAFWNARPNESTWLSLNGPGGNFGIVYPLGSHGLALTDSPEFTTSIKVGGKPVVTTSQVESSILDALSIMTFAGTIFQAAQADTKIAISTGVTAISAGPGFTVDIPLPTFKNVEGGTTTATKSQCKCFVAPRYWSHLFRESGAFPATNFIEWLISEDTSSTTSFRFQANNSRTGAGAFTQQGLSLMYLVIAVRD